MGYNFKSTQKRDENRWKGLPIQEPFGSSCTFVCDLLMVESVKCATKRTTKRGKDLVIKTHTRPEDSNDVRVTQPLSGNSSADKSDSILKISVDLWPVLTMAIEPKVDRTEICDELKNEEIVQTNEIKMAEQLKEARSTQKVHTLDKPLGRRHRSRSILPPLKTSDMQQSESLKSINPWFRPSLPPIVGFDKDPVDFAHSKSIIGKKYEEELRPMKSDMINNILNQNMVPQLQLPDISVSSIQMLIERVERQLDRGRVKLPEIKLPQAQRKKAEMSAKWSHSPSVHDKNVNQPITLRFRKEPQSLQWSINNTLHL